MPRTQRAHVLFVTTALQQAARIAPKIATTERMPPEHGRQPVPCSELISTRYGLSWKGIAVFSEPMIRLSPDGACHVCAMLQQSNNILPVLPLCVFVTKATS